MGAYQFPPTATAAQAGIAQLGPGVNGQATGVVGLVARPSELWVHASGSDTAGDGSAGNPYQTLTKAYAVILAGSASLGWLLHLPAGVWQEAIGLPPPDVTLRGAGQGRTRLEGPGASTLTWAEGASPGARVVEQMSLVANVSGADTGDLSLTLRDATPTGTLTNIGLVELDGCDNLPSLVNLNALRVRNHRSVVPVSLSLTYTPDIATNGLLVPGHRVEGGSWDAVAYSATDNGAPLEVVGARMNSLEAAGSAIAYARASRILNVLQATDASSIVGYDQLFVDEKPTLLGSGSFVLAEILINRDFLAGFVAGNVTIPLPKMGGGLVDASRVFCSFDTAGASATFVSSTATVLTLAVVPPPGSPAFKLRALVRPT